MGWLDYLILAAVAAVVALVVHYLIKLKKKGKSVCGCSSDCATCTSGCAYYNSTEPQENEQKLE